MSPSRVITGLLLTVAIAASNGCVPHRHGILHPADYGRIGQTPHLQSQQLIKDPLFYGHRPTRWRHWPDEETSWPSAAWGCESTPVEELPTATEENAVSIVPWTSLRD